MRLWSAVKQKKTFFRFTSFFFSFFNRLAYYKTKKSTKKSWELSPILLIVKLPSSRKGITMVSRGCKAARGGDGTTLTHSSTTWANWVKPSRRSWGSKREMRERVGETLDAKNEAGSSRMYAWGKWRRLMK